MTVPSRLEEIVLALERFIPKILRPARSDLDGVQSLRSISYAQTGKLPNRQDYVPLKGK